MLLEKHPLRAEKLSGDKIRQNIACIINYTTAVPFWFRNNAFECLFCDETYDQCYILHYHYQKDHYEINLDESHPILKRYRQNNSFLRLNIVDLTCKLCYQTAVTLDTMTDHLTTIHDLEFDAKITNNLIETFKLTNDSNKCHLCRRKFEYFKMLVIHMRENHARGDIKCDMCEKTFLRQPAYVTHKISVHGPGFPCDECGKEFRSKFKLKSHINKDHNDFKYKCFECDNEFPTPYQRRKHMITHTGAAHRCGQCDKFFTCSSHLSMHVRRVHLNEKNERCPICDMQWFDRHTLKAHMRKHVVGSDHVCHICGARYRMKRNRDVHMAKKHNVNRRRISTF